MVTQENALLALENQTSIDYDMPLRIISQDGAAYGTQVNNKMQKKRYAVITLVLYIFWRKVLDHPQEVANLLFALTKDSRFNINVEKQQVERSRDMMKSKMLDRAEARGIDYALYLVHLYVAGSDISEIAKQIGKDEAYVRTSLIKAGLIKE